MKKNIKQENAKKSHNNKERERKEIFIRSFIKYYFG
jgi:hypothetical protein